MAKFILHIDRPSGEQKTAKRPLDQDEVMIYLRDIMFRMALGEFTGVYITVEDALGLLEKQNAEHEKRTG